MTTKNNSEPKATTVQDDIEFDIDFSDWSKVRYPYWNPESGAVIIGEVLAIHKAVDGKFGKRDILELMVLTPTKVTEGKRNGNPVTKMLPKGEIARVEIRKAMGQLQSFLHEGDAVRIETTGKVPTDKGNDAWTFDVRYKSRKTEDTLETDD